MNNTKLKTLSILKGIGIIMIIIVHNRHFIMKDMSGYRQLINYGQMGCQLFFMVSGMALCYSWFKQIENSNNSLSDRLKNYGSFILKRYLRLAPGFLLIMCTNLILNYILIDILKYSPGYIMNRKPKAIIANIFFLHGLIPDCINNVFPGGWYIGTTFILYLLFPLLASLFDKLYSLKKYIIVFLPLIFLGINYIFMKQISSITHNAYYPHNSSFMYYFFLNQLPCFSLGIVLYFLERNDFCKKCPIILSSILFAITSLGSIYLYLQPEKNFIFAILPTLVGFSFFWLAVCMIHIEKISIEKTFMENPKKRKKRDDRVLEYFAAFLESCGNHSYGMYLVHSFISWYGIKFLTDTLTNYGYEYNDLQLYIILLLPSVLLVYVFGLYMDRLLNLLSNNFLLKKFQGVI